jgi:hypothetical protein
MPMHEQIFTVISWKSGYLLASESSERVSKNERR